MPQFVVDLARSPHAIPVSRALLCQCVLLCLCAINAFAQYGLYRFDRWTTDNGLPQNTVVDVIQTRDGYLWLTTFDGLARFDGVRFTVFDKSNSKGINSNRFTDLYEARDGTLLIGTEDAGLTVYRNGIFTTYTTADGLPSNQVLKIVLDPNGEPVIPTSKGPVYLRGSKIVPAPPQYMSQERKPYLSPSGAQVKVDASGVTRVQNGRVTHYPIKLSSDAWPHEDSRGDLWIFEGPNFYLLRDGQITCFPKDVNLHPRFEDADGGVWFVRLFALLDGYILARFKDGRFTMFGKADGVLKASIYSFLSDREGSVWIATSRGLYRARKRFMTAYSTESGLATFEVYPLMQSRDGGIWVGTTEGVSRVRFTDGKFESAPPIRAGISQALWEDAAGRIWIGTVGGLRRYENGKVQNFSVGGTVYDVKSDREGKYWVASERGLLKLDGDKIVARYTTKDGLPGDDVKIIHQDRRGTLWFGTYGGLAQFKDGKFTNYTAADGLAGNRVRTIYEESDGTLWIGTYDDGMSRFRDGKFFNYRTEHGLYNNGVFQILEDRRGYFWISCNKGIYRVSRRELDEMAEGRVSRINSVAFGKDDGMLNSECNGGRQPAGFVAEDGKLWFPTMDGVVVIDPDAAQVNSLPPPVLIESVRLGRNPVDFGPGVTVAPGRRDLEIAYAGLSFIKPEQVNFKYRMEGLDTEWVDAGTRRVAYFPYLSPGSYTFRVIAANSDGVWNNEGKALRILVEAPFYRTWWFTALVTLSLAGIAVLAYRQRFAALRARQRAQEAFSRQLIESQEAERKRIAAELHDSLGQHLLIIKNRAALGDRLAADQSPVKEQLDEINASATQAISEVRAIAYNLRPLHLDRLGLTAIIEEMIEKVARASGIEFSADIERLDGMFKPEDEINLYRIIQESINNIVKHARATRAAVEVWREDGDLRVTVRDDGCGFNAETLPEKSASRGFGLTGISERVRMLGGSLKISSAPDQGATLAIRIPLQDSTGDAEHAR